MGLFPSANDFKAGKGVEKDAPRVNSNNVYLYLLAEHYGIDYEKKGISVRGHIYRA